MGTSTRIEVYDPSNLEEPLARIIVPGVVAPQQLRKKLKIALVLVIDVGNKKKQKSVAIRVTDDRLRREIERYVDRLEVRLWEVESAERVAGAVRLGEVRTVED